MTSGDTGGGALIKKTYPIRGILWGIPFGLGLAVVLVVTTVIPLEMTQVGVVVVVGILIGLLWGLFGPAKKPKGTAPKAPRSPVVDTPEPPPAAPAATESIAEQPFEAAVDELAPPGIANDAGEWVTNAGPSDDDPEEDDPVV